MAITHPDPVRIPPHLLSEREVLNHLRTLPPDTHVFARVRLLDAETNLDREIDFLVVHPELGLVIVEVKGRGVEPRGDYWIRRNAEGREERLDETPGEQLLAQQYALLAFLTKAGLSFRPQVTRVLALPMLPLREDQDLGPDLPACRILTREKLKRPFESLRMAVTGGVAWDKWRWTPEAKHHQVRPEVMRQLLGALLPELLPNASLAEILKAEGRVQDLMAATLLDHLAQNFSGGRFHLKGGPGSGKSLLARKVSRLWASEGRRVLVLAFNRALTTATQCVLDELGERVQVSTYHDYAVNLLADARRLPPSTDTAIFFNQAVPEALADLLSDPELRPAPQWDALVVDEAQDLDPSWVKPLLGLLGDPESDPVLLLEDPAQSIYREARHDLGQPWRLDLSLRQHPALRRAACLAFPACGWEAPENIPEDGAFLAQRSSPETWKRDLAKHLETLAQAGAQPGQVMILAPHRPASLGLKDGQMMGPWGLNTQPDWWEGDEARADQVRMGTVQAFKGLEADIVIYLAPAYRHADGARLAYTAYSRARHRLIVLEKALAEPVRPKVPEASQGKPQPAPALPPRKLPSEGARESLTAALTAARNWRPNRKQKPETESDAEVSC